MHEGGSRNGAFLSEEAQCGGSLWRAPLLRTPKDMLKRYIKSDVKMPCKRLSLSIGASLGNLEGIRLPGFLREEDSISGLLSWTKRTLRLKSGGHLEL